ncbi:MAG: preprotein translocase subunit SecG [Rhodospirillales bacterium]|nr:preprotein translocase subunit SecG [Rhodospirillales bacterium]
MINIVLVVHLLLAIAMVAVIMLQRSEGGALGIGGGGGGGGGLMTGRAAGNLLTRTTAILATAFMVTSLVLAVLANTRSAPPSVLDQPLPLTAPAPVGGGQPAAPAGDTPQTPAPPLAR